MCVCQVRVMQQQQQEELKLKVRGHWRSGGGQVGRSCDPPVPCPLMPAGSSAIGRNSSTAPPTSEPYYETGGERDRGR